jgi:hypothetical protein
MHSALGRFLTRDRMEYVDGPSLYAYVGNRPINLRDPSGLLSKKDGGRVRDCMLTQLPPPDKSSTSDPELTDQANCNSEIMNKLYGKGLAEMVGKVGKTVIDSVFKGLPDELKGLKDIKDAIDTINKILDDGQGWAEDRIIDELAERLGISKDLAKRLYDEVKSSMTGDCMAFESKFDNETKGGESLTCQFTVCVTYTPGYFSSVVSLNRSIQSWTVIGTCDYSCTKGQYGDHYVNCCCGTSSQLFVKMSGGELSGNDSNCKRNGLTLKGTGQF